RGPPRSLGPGSRGERATQRGPWCRGGKPDRQFVPQFGAAGVVAQRPPAWATEVVGVDEVVPDAERGGVVEVHLTRPAQVVTAWVVGRRAPPCRPGRLAGGVPADGLSDRAARQIADRAAVCDRLCPRHRPRIG